MNAYDDMLWSPYKDLFSIVNNAITRPTPENFQELKKVLPNFRQNFLTLLKNPPKNEKHRQELNKGTTDGIEIPNMNRSSVLPKDLVTETIILSDMYDLNEYLALDLLGTAQQQIPNYPDLPRGAIAVLLYYDGRKSLVMTLKTLVQARQGCLWTVDTSPEVSNYITKYTDELLEGDIIKKMIALIETMDVNKEKDMLQKNRALGPQRYHREVIDLIESTKLILAETIYLWAAQTGLPMEPTLNLLNYLQNVKPAEENTPIDSITLILETAFLYCIDLSMVHNDDGQGIYLVWLLNQTFITAAQRMIPLIAGNDCGEFLKRLIKELGKDGNPWASNGLHALALMGWAITLSHLHMASSLLPPGVELPGNRDLIMDEAVQDKDVFLYLHKTFLENSYLYNDAILLHRIHSLITDFIIHMPHKVKGLRMRAEETARTIIAHMNEALEPPTNLPHHFEHMLLAIAKLYDKDPKNVQLEMDYWSPSSECFRIATFPYRAQPKKEALHAFIVETSEMLPSTLFVPYMKMLASLSSCPKGARQCYNLLKHNDNKTMTWDHFFVSFGRYFGNLRHENLPMSDTVYRARTFTKGISLHEQLGLQAVLNLIKSISENDPSTGEKFCQNQQWSALNILLGLVTCQVPITLKASLLDTLAAFAKSQTTAQALWHHIESKQLITTIPSTNSFQPSNIQNELEEVECRNEEYPLTRALLRLFNSLSDHPIPKLLGASQRIPGFDPYLNFILNSVLLKFVGRCYKNPAEKWELCESAMSLIHKLLLQYEPTKDEFLANHVKAYSIGTAQVNPPPGYHLMISLCSKSELLRLILLLIDEGCRIFDSYADFPGKAELENSILYALRMLEHGLKIQNNFLNYLHKGNSNILLVGLQRLMLGVNEVTNKPDHLLNISKYLTYQSWLPHHALPAIKILVLVTTFPTPQGHLLSLYLSTPDLKASIRHGFVRCLEAEEEVLDDGTTETRENVLSPKYDARTAVTEMKKAICQFLLQNINQGVPNVAHYLFGFDLSKEIKKTVFQQPGVLGQPRSCLHSIIGLLNSHLTNSGENSESLIELSYKVLYALSYNTRTSEPVLRFLRSSDFLKRHLVSLPFADDTGVPTDVQLRQMSWILKTVAIEMKVTAMNQQFSQLTAIVESFTGNSKELVNSDTTLNSTRMEKIKQSNQLVLRLIKYMKFTPEPVEPLHVELMDVKHIMKLIKSCETVEEKNKKINIVLLHEKLEKDRDECHDSMAHKDNDTLALRMLKKEKEKVVSYAKALNNVVLLNTSNIKFLDAWRQATEVMFAVATPESLNLEKRFNLLVDIIHSLLNNAVGFACQAEIANLVSGSILLLCVYLRQTYISEMGKGDETDSKLCNFMDSNNYKLTIIITNLVKWILSSGAASQKLRANLYAALLNFFHLNREKSKLRSGSSLNKNDSHYVTILNKSLSGDRIDIDIILAHGDRLVDMLCHDYSTGHDICKMLALSCLDMVVELDPQATWTTALSSRGYLKYIIDSLLEMDKHLVSLLTNDNKPLRALYVYESKMALLCRVASTQAGAEMLLDQNVLSCLSSLNVFNKHPDIITTRAMSRNLDSDFIPNVGTKYLQILTPAVMLCDAILSSMGVENQKAVAQVLRFLLSYGETVTLILRSGSPFHPLCYLKELSLITGVIARATKEDFAFNKDGMDPGSVLESASLFNRIQRLMLSLISRFVISESLLKEIEKEADKCEDAAKTKSEMILIFFKITSHLLIYARNIVSCSGVDRRISAVIFQPALVDSSVSERRDMLTMQEATLGVVVQQLTQAVSHYGREKSNLECDLLRKLKSIPDMQITNLKQFMPESSANTNDTEECRRQVTRILTALVEDKQKELELCFFIIEHCMYIIWTHLDYYMLRGISHKALGLPSALDKSNAMEFDVTWNVTSDDLNHLKQGLTSVFNDTFSTSLMSILKNSQDKNFLEAILRRIKKLIQFAPN